MKQNAGNEEFVCGGGFEWNAGCGGAASSATPAVARQHRHFRHRPPPPCPRHQHRRRGDGQQELRLQGLVKRSCIRRTPRPDTTGGGSLSNARAAESAVLLFATGGRGTPSGRVMHTPARAHQRRRGRERAGNPFRNIFKRLFRRFPGHRGHPTMHCRNSLAFFSPKRSRYQTTHTPGDLEHPLNNECMHAICKFTSS